jgi:hypothetical protein
VGVWGFGFGAPRDLGNLTARSRPVSPLWVPDKVPRCFCGGGGDFRRPPHARSLQTRPLHSVREPIPGEGGGREGREGVGRVREEGWREVLGEEGTVAC